MTISGPAFLLFYGALAAAANFLLRRHFRGREAQEAMAQLEHASDPYRIACLRAGPGAAAEVAVVSLVDRGLLEERDGRVRLAAAEALDYSLRPYEKSLLDACRDWLAPDALADKPAVRKAGAQIERLLGERALLADGAVLARRFGPYLAATGLTLGIAAARILQALSAGRSNIVFLVVLAVLCWLGLDRAYRRRRTGFGDALLERLMRLFAHLKGDARRIVPGGRSQDLAMLVAVYGLEALPRDAFPFVARLYPRRKGSDGDGGGGSDSGGCGGAGCGGGGCGGGCGG